MSAAFKALGNAYFAAKEWEKAIESFSEGLKVEKDQELRAHLWSNRAAALIHIGQLEAGKFSILSLRPITTNLTALSLFTAHKDARTCTDILPGWAKGFARLAEVLKRLKFFQGAIEAYEKAINLEQDPEAKLRYVSALRSTKLARTLQPAPEWSLLTTNYEYSTLGRVTRAMANGYKPQLRGSLAMLLTTYYSSGLEGFKLLEKDISCVNGQIKGSFGTQASRPLSDCLLVDIRAFILPKSSDPSMSLAEKLGALVNLDSSFWRLEQYGNSTFRWNAKLIVADLNQRLPRETWTMVKHACSVFIRGNIISAFIKTRFGRIQEALTVAQASVEVLKEGNRVWSNVDLETKGAVFHPTMIRLTKAFYMELLVEDSRTIITAVPLEEIESIAREILAENPQSDWPKNHADPSRLAYYVLPTVRAYRALAYTSAREAKQPISNVPAGLAKTASIEPAKRSARYFELAAKFLPDDDSRKVLSLFCALEQHLRADGKKVSEILKLAQEVETLRAELLPFYEALEDDLPSSSRDFVRRQIHNLRQPSSTNAARASKKDFAEQIVKPVLTANLKGLPVNVSPERVYENLWKQTSGDVVLFDLVGNERVENGKYV
ncbi:tetratricopeptide repeat protein [Sporobolomyces salmoneus]|uniref:tetratricopeptide repeat protein n=1 Tax=Sporobolomyces salmoneus TaxID=183962 RepID=UPI00317D2403